MRMCLHGMEGWELGAKKGVMLWTQHEAASWQLLYNTNTSSYNHSLKLFPATKSENVTCHRQVEQTNYSHNVQALLTIQTEVFKY